ncbi:MAG TPA: uroporphyrinogen decarboxylase family protein [Planctomycetota bacterium]|nr:uroporphyrinogen decarboxylase family protein [Planctomycetota bacterium]
MTPRERMLTAMRNGQPDCVPAAPDMSNMIPCRLTGKPFWDIYLHHDPPLWLAYIEAVKHFGHDGWLAGLPYRLDCDLKEAAGRPEWQEAIVARTPDRIYTRFHAKAGRRRQWSDWCNVYYIADPPTCGMPLAKAGLPTDPPKRWEDVERRTSYPGMSAFQKARELMGDRGVVLPSVGLPGLRFSPEGVYEYYDNPTAVIERCERERERTVRRTRELVAHKPDAILIGMSGHMIWNPEPIFRQLSLPTLQDVTALCKAAGVVSQIHCCGPEYSLVKIAAEESDLDNINPLEIPPMGDCDLGRLKREFGRRISLMGNLHTTEVMLKGSPDTVRRASRRAIDDAAEGGGFILSTGDQCGRDTPDENILALIEVARTYGRY